MKLPDLQEEGWEVLAGRLPADWEERAKPCGAMQRARAFSYGVSLLCHNSLSASSYDQGTVSYG